MNTLHVFVVLAFCVAWVSSVSGKTVVARQESGETENLRFAYDGHTHMLILRRQGVCYMFVLTDQEKSMVHTDTGLRNLELKVLGQISQPGTLNLTTIPKNVIHANILRECGKDVISYHIVQ